MICEVLGCTNRTSDKIKSIKFYGFPTEETFKQKWIEALTRDEWIPNPQGKVCSVHFKPDDVSRNDRGRNKLKGTAVPSILPFTRNQPSPQRDEDTSSSIEYVDVEVIDQSTNNLPSNKGSQLSAKAKEKVNTTNDFNGNTSPVITDVVDEMKAINKKIYVYLKYRRTRNCRLKAKSEKLKRFLLAIKEETVMDNPTLNALFENALKDPEDVRLCEDSNDQSQANPSDEIIYDITADEQPESTDETEISSKKTPYASYLNKELKKFPPEQLTTIKREIQNIVNNHARNKPMEINLSD